MPESTDVRLARIEEGLVALRGEIRVYHKEIALPMKEKVDQHTIALAITRRDKWWIGSLAGVAFSWIGMKLFGKG